MGRPKAPCGTDSAYRRHLRNKEPIDDACREAHAAERRAARRSPADASPTFTPPSEPETVAEQPEGDDMKLIVDTLRTAFKTVAEKDPTKLAPIAREFRSAVEASQTDADVPKEKSLAEQLSEARAARAAARAARAPGQDASA
ncbi:hypothetical protein [Pseudoclavibacter helvolus]|uniref:Uncharacterized protein n=1 Tax=Pseudoclavibacter helvolus TaxID=255205 RepID=A0A7W4UM37_9MICO|nr:hypothetical protein [Pseudoclavibacter helvolus]MBB2956980.1 hypothetical protein [Pseudoclavibacter helvolus]